MNFPSEAEERALRAAESRNMTKQERLWALADLIRTWEWLLERSPNRERQLALLDEQEEEENRRLLEFIRQHRSA